MTPGPRAPSSPGILALLLVEPGLSPAVRATEKLDRGYQSAAIAEVVATYHSVAIGTPRTLHETVSEVDPGGSPPASANRPHTGQRLLT